MQNSIEKAHLVSDDMPVDAMKLAGLLLSRTSCRAFLPNHVARDTTEAILRLAQLTPSWCNSQPWHATVVTGQPLARLSAALLTDVMRNSQPAEEPDLGRPAYSGQVRERRRESGRQLYESVGIQHGDRDASFAQTLENFRFFGAPHTMIITSDSDLGVYGAVDCGAYVTNIMLIAESFGVSTIAQGAIAAHPSTIRSVLQIPQSRVIVCALTFGFADATHPANGFRTRRASPDEAVSWIA